jgi:hypothetical protein
LGKHVYDARKGLEMALVLGAGRGARTARGLGAVKAGRGREGLKGSVSSPGMF